MQGSDCITRGLVCYYLGKILNVHFFNVAPTMFVGFLNGITGVLYLLNKYEWRCADVCGTWD